MITSTDTDTVLITNEVAALISSTSPEEIVAVLVARIREERYSERMLIVNHLVEVLAENPENDEAIEDVVTGLHRRVAA